MCHGSCSWSWHSWHDHGHDECPSVGERTEESLPELPAIHSECSTDRHTPPGEVNVRRTASLISENNEMVHLNSLPVLRILLHRNQYYLSSPIDTSIHLALIDTTVTIYLDPPAAGRVPIQLELCPAETIVWYAGWMQARKRRAKAKRKNKRKQKATVEEGITVAYRK